jgi:hypothetical protein
MISHFQKFDKACLLFRKTYLVMKYENNQNDNILQCLSIVEWMAELFDKSFN